MQDGLDQYDYGARFYDPVIGRWTSVDPLVEKYLQGSSYAFCFNNPLNFYDEDGREGVPVGYGRNSTHSQWPKLSNYQWYVIQGRTDVTTFNSAAVYNLNNNNSWAYTNISERNQFYGWADNQVSSKSRWFAAAEIVTRSNAVGAADGVNLWWLSDGADNFLQAGNKYLFDFNMRNAKSLINSGSLSGSFTDANGASISFDGKTGKALDYAMVQFEQTKVQNFITEYQKYNPNASMKDIISSINYSMSSSFAPDAIKKVIKEYFNTDKGQKAFNFSSYNDRVILGQKTIDQLYK